jgi:small GTP-binding protein
VENYLPTLGFEVSIKTTLIDGRTVILSIWDIGSQNPIDLRLKYFQGAAGFLIAFDITNRESFDALEQYCDEIRSVAPNAPIVLMGNKIDLPEHQISLEEVRQKAKKFYVIASTLTSAKSGEGVQEAFAIIGKALLQNPNPMF